MDEHAVVPDKAPSGRNTATGTDWVGTEPRFEHVPEAGCFIRKAAMKILKAGAAITRTGKPRLVTLVSEIEQHKVFWWSDKKWEAPASGRVGLQSGFAVETPDLCLGGSISLHQPSRASRAACTHLAGKTR
jgi:hypothetical protein